MALKTTRIAEKSLGTREIRNTNHGIDAALERETDGRTTGWHVVVTCNGIADYDAWFRTKREALEAYETL